MREREGEREREERESERIENVFLWQYKHLSSQIGAQAQRTGIAVKVCNSLQ